MSVYKLSVPKWFLLGKAALDVVFMGAKCYVEFFNSLS